MINFTLNPSGGMTGGGIIIVTVCLLGQLALLILGILAAVKRTEGSTTAIWILIVLMFPIIGPIIALSVLKKSA